MAGNHGNAKQGGIDGRNLTGRLRQTTVPSLSHLPQNLLCGCKSFESSEHLRRIEDRIDAMYMDKLDGRIDNGFFDRKAAEVTTRSMPICASHRDPPESEPELH
jgi:hypothetical protein